MKEQAAKNRETFFDWRDKVKEIDPEGWSDWYDNCQEIPDPISWNDDEIMSQIYKAFSDRIEEVKINNRYDDIADSRTCQNFKTQL
jgi:hypothetical protein